MRTDPKGVLTGSHKLSGNYACAEGALSAGCRFLGIYPIMPALEVSERYLQRAPAVDATSIVPLSAEIALCTMSMPTPRPEISVIAAAVLKPGCQM